MPTKLWWEHLKGRNNLEEMGMGGRVRQDISFICEVAVSPRTRVANLWHAERSWHAASTTVPICFIPFDRPVSLYCEVCVCVCVCVCTHTHTHTHTAWRLNVNYCCYQTILPVNHFFTRPECAKR